jgi:hypothetical protein
LSSFSTGCRIEESDHQTSQDGALVFMTVLVAAAEIIGRYRASRRSAEPPEGAESEYESVTTLALGAPS